MKIPEALAPGEGGGHLALDRLGLAEYVTFHGVGFSFYGLFELRFTTWRIGLPTLAWRNPRSRKTDTFSRLMTSQTV
jgi:hypothetical protein